MMLVYGPVKIDEQVKTTRIAYTLVMRPCRDIGVTLAYPVNAHDRYM